MTAGSDSRKGGGAGAPEFPLRVGVCALTVSDGCARGEREDASGDVIRRWVESEGFELSGAALVPDESTDIVRAILGWTDRELPPDLVVTTGGTGFGPRDVTPEATRAVVEREVPGIPERLRAVGIEKTPFAVLSRGVAGVRGRTLIVNLPGSPRAVREGLDVLGPLVPHLAQVLRATDGGVHPTGSSARELG